MIRKKLIIFGKVQGIGFRFFAQIKATHLSLTGYAKNPENGNVEINIQGESKNIDNFISILRKGNGFSRIDNITETELPIEQCETNFSAKY
ncbi:acylphosphatase [Clostridium cavendishii DSM 21758]|uniref:acylphosphatase n=1 Tax=Clostridium cavendishii DSM 21758 TaxID=1121302 RepID=A0A1M6AH91_9CLOT|nr:acylphosphatase [Clostridium cavendishii]SHI35884.1 acylphosphatase [Clostridium cavendishii DSM 21758]